MSVARNIADLFSKATAISTDTEISSAIIAERTTVATLSGKTVLAPAMTNIIVTPTSTTGTPITINGIASQSADYLNINTLTTGGTNIVKIDVNGNLGLGATPVAKLHVNGGIRQTGATVPFEWTVNPGAADYLRLNAVGYSNDLIVANSSGNIGIGTSTPSAKVDIYGSAQTNIGIQSGTQSKFWITAQAGTNILSIGGNGASAPTTGAINIDNSGLVTINGNFGIAGQITSTRANNAATGSGQLYLNGATGNRIDFNSNGVAAPSFTTRSAGTKIVLYPGITASAIDYAIGIEPATLWQSVDSPAAQFKWYAASTTSATLSGTGTFTAAGNITAYSDKRLKSNIKTIENALNKVSKLRGVSFDKDGESGIGVIAQEVQKVLPEVVKDGEYLSVAYGNIVGLLIEAVKEQQIQIEDLKNRLV